MARPAKPDTPYIVSIHKTGKYTYASSQRYVKNSDGIPTRKHVHWGVVDDQLKFHPGKEYWYISPEERKKLIFPEAWDLSEIEKLNQSSPVPVNTSSIYCSPEVFKGLKDRFYGAVWLLERISDQLGVRHDLMVAFDNDPITVDDVMTVAMFIVITKLNVDRLVDWQDIEKYPAQHYLHSSVITALEKSITDEQRKIFFQCRATRVVDNELCAVDSCTKTSFHGKLIDIAWGTNKEGLKLPVTLEVVVYSLGNHIPIYQRTLPGNMPDSKTIELLLSDLREIGLQQSLVLIFDRGYYSLKNLELFIAMRQKIICCMKVGIGMALEQIKSMGDFSFIPDGMKYSTDLRLFVGQYPQHYTVHTEDGQVLESDKLTLHLYFDPVRRATTLMNVEEAMLEGVEELERLIVKRCPIPSIEELNDRYPIYTIQYKEVYVNSYGFYKDADPNENNEGEKMYIVTSYSRDDHALYTARRTAGFRALLTLGLDISPEEAMYHYSLRGEQEKDHEIWKNLMACDRERVSNEKTKVGSSLIQFVGRILESYLRYSWRSTDLNRICRTTPGVLDEMRKIRCMEYPDQRKIMISPFVAKQIDICNTMGFPIPEGC